MAALETSGLTGEGQESVGWGVGEGDLPIGETNEASNT